MRIVNRVPTLDRPPRPDALYADSLAYWQGWQKRHPDVDLQAAVDLAVADMCAQLNEIAGIRLDPATIDTDLGFGDGQ